MGDPAIDDHGLYSGSAYKPAHPKRVGVAITARALVIHTTDMLEGTFDGLVRRISTEPGLGEGFHWVLGRTPAQGLVQMTSALRNGNHAGGSRLDKSTGKYVQFHGWYKLPDGQLVHPNTWSLGIEVHNAGYLGRRRTPAGWLHADSGAIVPDDQVHVDSVGRGWHKVTQYQLDQLGPLVDACRAFLAPMPPGVTLQPNGTYAGNGAQAAVCKSARVVGHWTLDPTNKTDPGPELTDWINALP